MRAAILCGGGIVSGKEIMVLNLSTGLGRAGFEIEVVNSRWSDGRFATQLKECGLPNHAVWFGFISATLDFPSLYMTVAQVLRWPQLLAGYRQFLHRFRPDQVIHTNWHSLLTIYPFLEKGRDLYWVHEVMPNKTQYRRVFRLLGKRLWCFVAVSHVVAESLRRLGIADDKIRVIYNGVAGPDHWGSVKSQDGRIRVGIVGQIGHWKGHEVLLDAFSTIIRDYPHAELHIFGKGAPAYEEFLRRRVTELGLDQNVVWRGFVSDPSMIYEELSVVVVPSLSEDPLPTAAIEAAFFAIPVIASRRGGLEEIVEDCVTGYLIQPGKPLEIASRLSTLLADTALRNKMGAAARVSALRKFDRRRFIQDFVELLASKD